MPHVRSTDRRVQKTRDLLHGALASLIHEKSYDAIVVKEILARANVGRSTFYTHFRDKNELLDSGIRDVLRASETTASMRSTGSADWVLRFSLPVLEHIERYREASGSSVDTQRLAVVHERLQEVLVELIAYDLKRVGQRHQESERSLPCELLARHVASTFLLVLNWWVERGEPLTSKKVNDLFRAMILPAVSEALSGGAIDAR